MNAEQIKTAETLQSLADNATKALELASFHILSIIEDVENVAL